MADAAECSGNLIEAVIRQMNIREEKSDNNYQNKWDYLKCLGYKEQDFRPPEKTQIPEQFSNNNSKAKKSIQS